MAKGRAKAPGEGRIPAGVFHRIGRAKAIFRQSQRAVRHVVSELGRVAPVFDFACSCRLRVKNVVRLCPYLKSGRAYLCWWVGHLAFGEGWHNNHHAYPRSAPHGHRWWEIDMTYWVIYLMKSTGLAWNVVQQSVTIPAKVA